MIPTRSFDMKNDLLNFLEKNKLGWMASCAQQCGELFVSTLVDVLWYVDGNHQTLAIHGHGVPVLLICSLQQEKTCQKTGKKRKIDHTKLKAAELLAHSSNLSYLTRSTYMKKQQWSKVREAVLCLGDNLNKHAIYLNHRNEAV